MPVVLLSPLLVMVGASIIYLLAQPMVRSMLGSIVSNGGVLGRLLSPMILYVEQAVVDLFKRYVWSSTVALVHWLHGLATNVADFPREVRAFATATADAFDHLVTVTVHDIVKAFVNPVRDAANAAQADATAAANAVVTLGGSIPGRISRAVEAGIAGIWSQVHAIADAAAGGALSDAERYADRAAHAAEAVAGGVAGDLRGLERDLGELVNPRTAAEVVAGVAGLAGVVALVETQVMPLVRDLTECAPKLKATCQTDISEWLGLLEGLVLAGSIPSLYELAQEAQATVLSLEGDVASLAGIGELVGNIPLDPRAWV